MSQQVKKVQSQLRQLGWPIKADGVKGAKTKEAIRDFKRMFAFWKRGFAVKNALITPRLKKALTICVARDGRCSEHFYFREFKSKGNGWIKGHRRQVRGLEMIRRRAGAIGILSAYRDPHHNDVTVGGAEYSQHKLGLAIDPSTTNIRRKHLVGTGVSGIGLAPGTGETVAHLDWRHLGKWNYTNGSPKNPTIWRY